MIGSILMVGITVAMAAALVLMVSFTEHVPEDSARASMTADAGSGQDEQWGTGDEAIHLRHTGGAPVQQAGMTVIVQVDGDSHRFSDADGSLAHGDQGAFGAGDDRFSLGDDWRSPTMTIPAGAFVDIDIVTGPDSSTVTWSGTVTAAGGGSS